MDEEKREHSNWDDKTIPLEENHTVPLSEKREFSNQVRRPKLKHPKKSNSQSPYEQSQHSQSGGNANPYSQNPCQQGGYTPSGNNNPYQQHTPNSYGRQPYQQAGQNPYSNQPYQQGNPNPYGQQPYQQGNPNLYGQQPYQQGNPNPYSRQPYQQENPNPYNHQPYQQGGQVPYKQQPYTQPPEKKHSKMPFIIAGAFVAVLFLGGLAIGLFSSNKSKSQASKESSQKADQGDSSKILVQDNTFDTVVTAKSKDIDNIKLFKEPGKKKKAGKVQEGVPCALLQEKTVDGEKWAKIDFCNRQGWCRMDKLRTISGDVNYFYVKANSENIVFVNEQAIKLHTGAGQDTSIAATDVKYGTELNISKVEDGWGRTTYQNKECWIDMNVVGFYASEYWQVERCDGSTNGIKLRKSSTEDSEQLTTVPLCTKFQSSESRNGWAKFTYGGKTGWMKLHYATPCGSSKGLSFTEDKTASTTETKATFGYEVSPIAGNCYIPDRKEYMVISNVTDSQFDFEIYDVEGLCFKHHTAVAISEDTARYYGDKYTLTFGLDTQGISVDGCDDIVGSDAFFIYEEWLDDGEN
nr:hypothetical protein [uncultured Anaerobutyricum sp.]